MTFAQLHDGFYRNPKVQAAGSVAAWMWAASIGYASEGLTDGFIPLAALASLCPDLDTKPRLKVAARLVEVGLWEVAEGGWRIHDYLKWNYSKAAVLAKREATLARVNKHRSAPRHGEGNALVMRSNADSNAVCNGVTNAASNTTPSDPLILSESSKELSSPTPAAPPTAPALTLTSEPEARDERPAKAKRPKAEKPAKAPPPFSIGEAFEAIASAARGRFTPGVERDWITGIRIRVAQHVRAYPDLAEWKRVGAWLASGAEKHRGVVGPSWAASGALPDAMARSRVWQSNGCPALNGAHAEAAPTREQVTANVRGKAYVPTLVEGIFAPSADGADSIADLDYRPEDAS